ncbi:SAM-dependent methyltransferase [Actinoplanes sp. NPDC051411]|uniref:SAM-dependent methyltransferase n=1 Tax=Actinoplanes sp. NPDC051411 TaxID=3155522 RepID=UPI00342EABAA
MSRFDVGVAHPARRYNYWLGGKDNFAADRASGDAIAATFPTIRDSVRENRKFLRRAVEFLAGQAGIDQFLDVGTGLPTADNTHEVAQRITPRSRIVYVDNDPIVLAHARALLTSSAEGATAYIDADLRDPAKILEAPPLQATLDFTRPIALVMLAVLHFVHDHQNPYAVVGRLVEALPPGSYLVMSHATYDLVDTAKVEVLEKQSGGQWRSRSRDEFARFFDGLELIDPGVVPIGDWRPAPGTTRPDPAQIVTYGAVGRVGTRS